MPSWMIALLLFIHASIAAELIKIPLFPRRGDGLGSGHLSRRLARRGVGYSPLLDHVVSPDVDFTYLGALTLGTPPQSFFVLIDTGSYQLWVMEQDCQGCNASTAHLFDPSASSTAKQTGQEVLIRYVIGAVVCDEYSDTVFFGGITMDNFTFGSCYGELDLPYPESIGTLGIGFPFGTGGGDHWIIEAYQRSLIPAPAYSLTFARYSDYIDGQGTDGSLLVIGGYDQDLLAGPINWIPCSATKHFQIPLDGIIINNRTIERVDGQPFQTIIDSGTGGVLIGPKAIVDVFYSLIPGSSMGSDGYYRFPCSELTAVGFQLGGQNYMMDLSDFILVQSGETCVGSLVGLDEPDDTETELVFLLGALFMKNVMTVFNLGMPAVGFGRLKNTNAQYGGFTSVPQNEVTALGTGPSASLSPTLTVSNAGLTLNLFAPTVTVVQGTSSISVALDEIGTPQAVPTSPGAALYVTSNIPLSTLSPAMANSPTGGGPLTMTRTVTGGAQSGVDGRFTGDYYRDIRRTIAFSVVMLTIFLLA